MGMCPLGWNLLLTANRTLKKLKQKTKQRIRIKLEETEEYVFKFQS